MTSKPFLRPAIGAVLILSIPLVMTLVDRDKPLGAGWHWGPMDFVVMGALLMGAGWAFEVLAARTPKLLNKVAIGAATLAVVVLVWAELAVDAVSQGIKLFIG